MVVRSVAFRLSCIVRTRIRVSHRFLMRRNLAGNATNMVWRCQSAHFMAIHGVVVEKSLFDGQSTYITQECSAGTYFNFRRYVLRWHLIPPVTNEPLKHCQRTHFVNFATAQINFWLVVFKNSWHCCRSRNSLTHDFRLERLEGRAKCRTRTAIPSFVNPSMSDPYLPLFYVSTMNEYVQLKQALLPSDWT